MKKTFLFIAAALMSIGMWAESASVELCTSWNTAFAYATEYTQDYTIDDLDGGTTTMTLAVQGVYRAGAANTYFQMNKKDGHFKNTTKLPGKITKIETTWSTAKNPTKCYFATDAEASSSDSVVTVAAATSVTYTPNDKKEYYYFNIDVKTGSGAAQLTSCVVYYETSTTPQRTLESIYIAGTATKLEYIEGEEFDPAGLKVMGHYDTGDDTEITAGITWSSNPEVFALGDESVEVIAQIKNLESDPFIVNGIVVNAKPAAKYVPVAWNEIEDGGKYFITANNDGEYYFAAKAFAAGNATAIAFDASLAPEADMWIFTQDGDAWKISAADGEGLYMTNANNGLVCAADKGADFTVAQGSSAEFTKLTASDGTNDRCVALYNQQDFRSYKASTTSGIQDLKLYGLKKEGVVTKPSFTPTDADFDQEVTVTLTAEEGAAIFYALNEAVTSMNAIPYTQPIVLTDTTTIYAVAKKDGKESEQVNKTYNLIPVFASLADLVANMPAGENAVKVKVTITSAAIDSFYVNKSGYRNGVYVTAANTAVELYEYNVPETWVAGGTVSGTIIAGWLSYNGILELQKWENGWDAISYTAPDPTALQDIIMHGNVRKLMHRGHIMILKDNKLFNLQGCRLK